MYISSEESIQPFQKVFLGRGEVVRCKLSDTPREVPRTGKATAPRLDKEDGSPVEQSESNRSLSVGQV